MFVFGEITGCNMRRLLFCNFDIAREIWDRSANLQSWVDYCVYFLRRL